ncbi:RpiR family transcriptional regulator [Breoghania corrubedonensis]|uniref:RpiR family transcriptional regulator n=1 Tax=Breoghania corrubedonensis TaxID=665038 RepID=A0A2T5VC75_9HYPH|nr:RpiR family transcriptional regulator [Breoghania corrubedonensis]
MRQQLTRFTDAERRVAQALLADYPVAGLETVARFAKRAGTSGPTILRFVSRLGFQTYADFQNALHEEIHVRLQGPLTRYPSQGHPEKRDLTENVTQALADNISKVGKTFHQDDLQEITALLCDEARTVFFLGGRFSHILATYFHHYMRELHPRVRLVRDTSAAWADYLLDVKPGDVLVTFDFRRYQADVLEFAKAATAQGATIILITDVWYSPIASLAHKVVACPVEIPSAFDSGVAGLATVEIIVSAVVEELGTDAKERMTTLEGLRKSFRLGQ